MAQFGLGDLFQTIGTIKEFMGGLQKDVSQDPRENTSDDLVGFMTGMGQLSQGFSQLENGDIGRLASEVQQLLAGKQSVSEYLQDCTKIITELQDEVVQNPAIAKKLEQNLPASKQINPHGEDIQKVLAEYKQLFKKLENWGSKIDAQRR